MPEIGSNQNEILVKDLNNCQLHLCILLFNEESQWGKQKAQGSSQQIKIAAKEKEM